MDNRSTITLQQVIDYARAHIALKPLLNIGGISNEPGLSICNDVLQFLLGMKPRAWKFNRFGAAISLIANQNQPFFVTQFAIQDYLFAGACAFTLNPVVQNSGQTSLGGGGVGIDLASNNAVTQVGNLVTVQCLQPHNFTLGQTVYMNNVTDANGNLVAGFNSLFTQSTTQLSSLWSNGWTLTAFPTPSSFQFVNNVSVSSVGGSPGIANFGWLTDAAILDINNSGVPQPQGPIRAVDRITPTYRCDETKELCVVADLGTGVLQFRVGPNADVYNMAIFPGYQARAPKLTNLGGFWAPWPDRLAIVLRTGVKAFAYQLSDKSDTFKLAQMSAFEVMANQAAAADDAEDQNLGFAPVLGIMR